MMNGERSIAEIATELAALPDTPDLPAATLLEEVRDLAARYGR